MKIDHIAKGYIIKVIVFFEVCSIIQVNKRRGINLSMALVDDLQKKIMSLDDFKEITTRILIYIPEVISSIKEDRGYVIIESTSGGTQKFTRPYNSELFIKDPNQFETDYNEFERILNNVSAGLYNFS